MVRRNIAVEYLHLRASPSLNSNRPCKLHSLLSKNPGRVYDNKTRTDLGEGMPRLVAGGGVKNATSWTPRPFWVTFARMRPANRRSTIEVAEKLMGPPKGAAFTALLTYVLAGPIHVGRSFEKFCGGWDKIYSNQCQRSTLICWNA
jgi:hypothetical protein